MICIFKGFSKGLIVLDKMFDRNAVTVDRQGFGTDFYVLWTFKIVIFRSSGCQSSCTDNFWYFEVYRDHKSVDGSKIISISTLETELMKFLHNNLQIL